MRIACIMMQKDERYLLRPWIQYHSNLFGSGNLYIFDNGSTDAKVDAVLRDAESLGVRVDRKFSQRSDYNNKGDILGSLIKRLDATNPYDFYFPLDCDEFIACEDCDGISCNREKILSALEGLRNQPSVLAIFAKYWHTPFQKDAYMKLQNIACRKVFFSRNSFMSMDEGYHNAKTITGQNYVTTKIVYFEFHNQPYRQFIASSRRKLETRTHDFTRKALKEYIQKRKGGYHCARALLLSKYEYWKDCIDGQYSILDNTLLRSLECQGIDYSNFFEQETRLPRQAWIFTMKIGHQCREFWINARETMQLSIRMLRKAFRIISGRA